MDNKNSILLLKDCYTSINECYCFRFRYATCTIDTRSRNFCGWRSVANPDLEVRSSWTEPCRIVYPSARPDSPPNVWQQLQKKNNVRHFYRSPFDAQGDEWRLGKDSLDCRLNHCTWSFALNFRASFNSSEAWKYEGWLISKVSNCIK